MEFLTCAVSDIGAVRKNNEDSLALFTADTPIGAVVFAAVCDGMGGLQKGELASAAVVRDYASWFENEFPALSRRGFADRDIRRDWTAIAIAAGRRISDHAAEIGAPIGTTATVMLLTQERYYIMNIGDSRAYEICSGARAMTEDQSFVAREVRCGRMTPEQALTDPRRNMLLQCIGASEEPEPDMYFGTPKYDAVYMLCSDGMCHEITGEEMDAFLGAHVSVSEAAMEKNLCALRELNKSRGERDNMTAVLVRTYREG